MFNPIFKENAQRRTTSRELRILQNQNYLVTESLNVSVKMEIMAITIPMVVTTIIMTPLFLFTDFKVKNHA